MDQQLNRCFLCGREIAVNEEKLVLLKHEFCAWCEKKLVNTTVEEESYLYYKERIKEIWFS